MHYMNIDVNGQCAPGTIGLIQHSPHTMCMDGTRHFLREWREHRGKTLVQVAEYLHMTHGTLSKIERGKVPYNQKLLENLADLYMCDVPDLIVRDPSDPIDIWSVWDKALPGDRRKIVDIARTIVDDSEAA